MDLSREKGHLQAVGRDARGRKQYRYHPDWRSFRDRSKYDHLLDFGRILPKIRSRVSRDLRRKGLPREKVLGTVIALLEMTLIRVGNDEYARTNHSYGLTTLQDRHFKMKGKTPKFSFVGKSGKKHEIELRNSRLISIVKKCRDLPGQELFQYVNAHDQVVDVTSTDVNQYLHEIAGVEFTAKDFRTWAGTVLAFKFLREFVQVSSKKEAKSNLIQAIENVARLLGNTPSICKRCYIHPHVLNTYLKGSFHRYAEKRGTSNRSHSRLSADESALLSFLKNLN
ncbi:MAG: DNA topoisomerase IB [Verrucomicrobiota bacterium]